MTFTPHLLPLDQGELVSCYVTTTDVEAGDVVALYEEAYAAEPFVDVVTRPPGVRDVRETNICSSTSRPIRGPARSWPSARSTTCGRARRRRPCSR